ncbi:MAG TPA: dihydrodipicolinate synthase family protein [Woeseiaceae bacterium]|nr:dihydrodipicolinate synthase family protein [Woeseiaceae bacterium]
MRFEGIYVPLITTFGEGLDIDYGAWGEAIDWQLEHGTHGIIVGGSTGEFFSLTKDERIEQFAFARQRIDGRVPLVAGVNALVARECYELAAAARDAGADALLVAAPPYSQPSQEELAAHVLEIDRVADLPILLYNYPSRTGTGMDKAFLDRVSQSPNVVAIKESSGDGDRIRLLAGEYRRLQLSAGGEHQVLEFFAWGARSWVSVIANFMPREAAALFDTCVLKNDFASGRERMQSLLPLLSWLEQGGRFLPGVKFACEVMGRPGGALRPPFLPLSKAEQAELRGILEAATAR